MWKTTFKRFEGPWSASCRPYHLKSFKGCLLQILFGLFLNTLSHILFTRTHRKQLSWSWLRTPFWILIKNLVDGLNAPFLSVLIGLGLQVNRNRKSHLRMLLWKFSKFHLNILSVEHLWTAVSEMLWYYRNKLFFFIILPSIYLLKVNNKNTRTRSEIYSKLTIKTPERLQWRRSGVFIVIFEHVSHLVLVFLWTLNR